MKAVFLIICLLLAAGCEAGATPPIDQDRAAELAAWYFARYFPREGCGGAGLPTVHGDHWEAAVRLGRAGTPRGEIHVGRSTGRVSYRGPFLLKPSTSALSLDRWAARQKDSGTRGWMPSR